MKHLLLEKPEESADRQKLAGLTFVITGSLEHFSNRSEMKNQIEALWRKSDWKRDQKDQLSDQQRHRFLFFEKTERRRNWGFR